jgi:GT2 family glycosyltransferase
MPPEISLVILNYNGEQWLDRCLESICRQTAVERLEVIITDNGSTDRSREISERYAPRLPRLNFINNGKNLWYCEANNIGAADARSPLVFILNNDLWLEPDCVEKVLKGVAVHPDYQLFATRVLNYDDNTYQGMGGIGFDLFGIGAETVDSQTPTEMFSVHGCSFVIRKDFFFKVGAYPPELLIYGDEFDLGWRIWVAGGRGISIPDAQVHHRGAAVVNPAGGTKAVELRTNAMKRYLSARNSFWTLLKNCQHILLLLVIPHLFMLFGEAMYFLYATRSWKFVRDSYVRAMLDTFRMRSHIFEWRRKIKSFRIHGDFWMLRFLYFRATRLAEFGQVFKMGAPKVDVKK